MEVSTSIVEWYKNQVIFLTGGSGFIGKGLIFKLLQCGAPKIYLLIRGKKGQTSEQRLDNLAKHWVFDSLRANGVDVKSKLVVVAGDTAVPQLGISEKDRLMLQEDVTVILHVAASIKFDDPLKLAVFYNLRSARDVVELAKGMKKLKILHHVSTAYCNYDALLGSAGITENIYPPKMDWKKLIEFVETAPEAVIDALEVKLVGELVNTYLLTKHLAEKVISDACHEIPVTISRPPVVLSSLKEPDPGWLDNLASPILIGGGTAKGVVRVISGDNSVKKALAPLDVVVNTILVSSWNEAIVKKGDADGHTKVFNGEHTLKTVQDLIQFGLITMEKCPPKNALWRVRHFVTTNMTVFLFSHLIVHVLPGMFFDLFLRITGKKPRLIKIYRRLYIALSTFVPFLSIVDYFTTTNTTNLKKEIPENEREIFFMDIPESGQLFMEWYYHSAIGVRKFFGDPPYPTAEDFAHQKRLYWIDVACQVIIALLFFWLVPSSYLIAPFLFVTEKLISLYDCV